MINTVGGVALFNHMSRAFIKLFPKLITFESADWEAFLEMNYTYIKESWGNKLKDEDLSSFKKNYGFKLQERLKEGGRGLFFYYPQKEMDMPIGFSNAFLSQDVLDKVLNIAEFYVVPQWRGQGVATSMLSHLIEWGKEQQAVRLRIEVDKDKRNANQFWAKFGYHLDSSGDRNVYSTTL
jgi:GNAT superfamily N-acetyltransferase